MLKIIKNTGFKSIFGIEYEGDKLPAEAGIKATKELLIKTAKEI